MDNHTAMIPSTETLAQFWTRMNNAIWRTCRRNGLKCSECKSPINAGDRYLDTRENDGRVWATLKLCGTCADKPSGLMEEEG